MAIRRSTRLAAGVAPRAGISSTKRQHMKLGTGDDALRKRSQTKTTENPITLKAGSRFDDEPRKKNNHDSKVKRDYAAASDETTANKKWKAWSANATSTPYPEFGHPTNQECQLAYDLLEKLHNDAVEIEFEDANTPETIPFVLDALIVAVLSQATSWSNAKRAMDSMKEVYGSVFAYDKISAGGPEKLEAAIRPGGLHVRKTKIIMSILEDVKRRYGKWDLDHLLEASDEDAMEELMSYKYVGPKSAFVVLGWCLKRNRFTVDTHVYRIAGLWGWRPKEATREKTQSHLDAVIPVELKFKLHFFLIQHGRTCPACRGGSVGKQPCEVQQELRRKLNAAPDLQPSPS